MDPNETLRMARTAAAAITSAIDNEEDVQFGNVERLAEAFEALDEWLSKGGFVPDAWRRGDEG